MSARCLTLALSLLVAMPVFSQGARFIKVDIVGKSVKAACKNADGPTEVHVRMPINLAKGFSPIDQLSAGRSITWLELFRAVVQIILVLGGILAALGIWAFTRRELATAQPQS